MAEQKPYEAANFSFRTDHAGGPMVIRPNEIIVKMPMGDPATVDRDLQVAAWGVLIDMGDLDENDLPTSMAELLPSGSSGSDQLPEVLTHVEQVRGRRHLYAVRPRGTDIVRFARGLREEGIAAQPNHVYFVNSQPLHISANFTPNMFAPNMFAPNMFAPNMFAPNMFAPNMFAGGMAGVGGCCCPRGLSAGEDRIVPRLLAKPLVPTEGLPAVATVEEPTVQVHIIDVSRLHEPRPLNTASRAPGIEQSELGVDENKDGFIDPATGHGIFVKDILDRYSGLESHLHPIGSPLGDIDDASLVGALKMVVDAAAEAESNDEQLKWKVLNLSLSGYTENDQPSLVLADEIESMIADDWLIVASAGNDASCRLTWPAALPGVVAVGAVDHCIPAWFSNYGSWVDASAAGVDVVAAFPDLTGTPALLGGIASGGTDFDGGDYSTGFAEWSGTSFSAPLVAARLAAHLQANAPADPREAITAVLEGPTVQKLPLHGSIIT